MKKILLVLAIIVCLAPKSYAQPDIAAIKDSTSLSRDLNSLYMKALSRERLRSYADALYAYNVILARVQALVNSRNTNNETLGYAMPYAIAAAYRKGIVTHRSIEGSVVKLYNQLKLYEESEKWINEVLTEISNLEFERGMSIPEAQYGMLYFARAYNKMGWAYALFNGNYWKRYLIYTPADTILMVDKAMDDLNRMYAIYKDSFRSPALSPVGAPAEAAVDFNDEKVTKFELMAFSLCYSSNDVSRLKILMGRQIEGTVTKTLSLSRSPVIESNLNAGRRMFTFEDLLDPKSRDVATAMAEILKGMGSN